MPSSLELISQNQPVIQQCFSLTTNQYQHQQQAQKPSAQQDISQYMNYIAFSGTHFIVDCS
jgi:hypothetical protein